MELTYGIKNFRVFDTKGTTFNLKPITILTGANCAGKSSLVKSLLLLQHFFEHAEDGKLFPKDIPLSFSDETVYINGFDSAINNRSKDCKEMAFTITKKGFTDNVKYSLELVFSSKESSLLNDGWLKCMRFSCIIDDVCEPFMEVKVTPDGKYDFSLLDLSGNIYSDFKRCLDLASYNKLFEDCRSYVEAGFFYDRYPNDEDINKLDEQFKELEKKIRSNPLNEWLDFTVDSDFIFDWIDTKRFKMKRQIPYYRNLNTLGVLPPSYNAFIKTGVLMYMPLLDTVGKMSPAEFSAFIDTQKEIDPRCIPESEQYCANIELGSTMDDLMVRVADDFKASGNACFEEYYKELEKRALADVGTLSIENDRGKEWTNDFIENYIGSGQVVFKEAAESVVGMLDYLGPYPSSSLGIFSKERKTIDFYFVYHVLTYLQRKALVTDKIKYYGDASLAFYEFESNPLIRWVDPRYDDCLDYPESYVFTEYKRFIEHVRNSLLSGAGFIGVKSIGSFVCPVMRSYSIYDKSNPFSTILLSYINTSPSISMFNRRTFKRGDFINKWIKEMGIGRGIDIDMNDDSTAFRLRIIEKNGSKHSSADFGHGVTQLLSILLHIETAILQSDQTPHGGKTTTLCFEEPEVSLHPSWQSTLARIFRDAYENYGIHFIIETHSEYLTRASQAMVAQECKSEADLKRFPFVVYYMERDGSAYDLEYQLSGRFNRSFGSGFFDEASKSSIKILEREKKMRHGKND